MHRVGAAFEGQLLSFGRRENRAPEYLALNPEGKTSTPLIDGRSLTAVAAILFYLARRFPKAGLLPRETEGQAQALSMMSSTAAMHPFSIDRPHEVRTVVVSAEIARCKSARIASVEDGDAGSFGGAA